MAVASVAAQLAKADPTCVYTSLHVLTVRPPSGNPLQDLPGRMGVQPMVVSEEVLAETDARGRAIVDLFSARMPEGCQCHGVLERGAVARVVSEHAQHADLVLMGLHGETEDEAPGTGGTHVMRTLSSVTPMLLVHHARPYIRRIAIGYDGSASAAHALGAVRQFTQSLPLPVDAIHVSADGDDGGLLKQVDAQLPGIDVTHHYVKGTEPHLVLAETAEKAGADVLALGFSGMSTWRDFLFGSATEYLLENTTLSLLVAH